MLIFLARGREGKMTQDENDKSKYPPRSDLVALRESLFDIVLRSPHGNESYKIDMEYCIKHFESIHKIPKSFAEHWLSILRMGRYIGIIKEESIWYVVIDRKR